MLAATIINILVLHDVNGVMVELQRNQTANKSSTEEKMRGGKTYTRLLSDARLSC